MNRIAVRKICISRTKHNHYTTVTDAPQECSSVFLHFGHVEVKLLPCCSKRVLHPSRVEISLTEPRTAPPGMHTESLLVTFAARFRSIRVLEYRVRHHLAPYAAVFASPVEAARRVERRSLHVGNTTITAATPLRTLYNTIRSSSRSYCGHDARQNATTVVNDSTNTVADGLWGLTHFGWWFAALEYNMAMWWRQCSSNRMLCLKSANNLKWYFSSLLKYRNTLWYRAEIDSSHVKTFYYTGRL